MPVPALISLAQMFADPATSGASIPSLGHPLTPSPNPVRGGEPNAAGGEKPNAIRVLLPNQHHFSAAALMTRYAHRAPIENGDAESVGD